MTSTTELDLHRMQIANMAVVILASLVPQFEFQDHYIAEPRLIRLSIKLAEAIWNATDKSGAAQ